jgi:hypothetical protein
LGAGGAEKGEYNPDPPAATIPVVSSPYPGVHPGCTGCRVHPGCTKALATNVDQDVEYRRGAEDESAIPRVLKKFVNKASDREAEMIRLDKDEPIQQELRLRSRPRWYLRIDGRKVTGAVGKHLTARANQVHAGDYLRSRGDHESPIRIGDDERDYGISTEMTSLRYAHNKWNSDFKPKIFTTKFLSDWLPIRDLTPGRGSDFANVILRAGQVMGECGHCNTGWDLQRLWCDCKHPEAVAIRQEGKTQRVASVTSAGWLDGSIQTALAWWVRAELVEDGTRIEQLQMGTSTDHPMPGQQTMTQYER